MLWSEIRFLMSMSTVLVQLFDLSVLCVMLNCSCLSKYEVDHMSEKLGYCVMPSTSQLLFCIATEFRVKLWNHIQLCEGLMVNVILEMLVQSQILYICFLP
ncbi:hypothetical protein HS088_TW06G00164 [Tripterygium wilfordii]|uniref:Uncharacterized protein n=1 Tax=Tripterygium wilfordii TaxID=458696 RepID=A0A7J7DI81_TRIWF|nr:hypothetical protein HS088_TW06G00164 [Tripterygium wilfordii]